MLQRKAIENSLHTAQSIASDLYLSHIYNQIYRNFHSITTKKTNSPLILEIGGGALKYTETYWERSVVTDADEFESHKVLTGIRAEQLPFKASEFDYVIAKDSLHHFKDPIKALLEIDRVLKPGGSLIVSEPYWSPLGRLVYRFIHPEPWDTKVTDLNRESEDLWDSNQALLLLLNTKFANQFRRDLPTYRIELYKPTYALSYLISGGVHNRTRVPSKFLIWLNRIELKSELLLKMSGLNVIAEFRKVL